MANTTSSTAKSLAVTSEQRRQQARQGANPSDVAESLVHDIKNTVIADLSKQKAQSLQKLIQQEEKKLTETLTKLFEEKNEEKTNRLTLYYEELSQYYYFATTKTANELKNEIIPLFNDIIVEIQNDTVLTEKEKEPLLSTAKKTNEIFTKRLTLQSKLIESSKKVLGKAFREGAANSGIGVLFLYGYDLYQSRKEKKLEKQEKQSTNEQKQRDARIQRQIRKASSSNVTPTTQPSSGPENGPSSDRGAGKLSPQTPTATKLPEPESNTSLENLPQQTTLVPPQTKQVRGYTRADGTQVRSYTRAEPYEKQKANALNLHSKLLNDILLISTNIKETLITHSSNLKNIEVATTKQLNLFEKKFAQEQLEQEEGLFETSTGKQKDGARTGSDVDEDEDREREDSDGGDRNIPWRRLARRGMRWGRQGLRYAARGGRALMTAARYARTLTTAVTGGAAATFVAGGAIGVTSATAFLYAITRGVAPVGNCLRLARKYGIKTDGLHIGQVSKLIYEHEKKLIEQGQLANFSPFAFIALDQAKNTAVYFDHNDKTLLEGDRLIRDTKAEKKEPTPKSPPPPSPPAAPAPAPPAPAPPAPAPPAPAPPAPAPSVVDQAKEAWRVDEASERLKAKEQEKPTQAPPTTTAPTQEPVTPYEGLTLKKGDVTGGGPVQPGVIEFARHIQKEVPGFLYFSGFNDIYHQKLKGNSFHKRGLAIDFTVAGGKKQSAQAVAAVQKLVKQLGIKNVDVLDEYKNLSARGTGGHIHVEFENKDSIAQLAKPTYSYAASGEAQAVPIKAAPIPQKPSKTESNMSTGVQQNLSLIASTLKKENITDKNTIAAVLGNVMKESQGIPKSENLRFTTLARLQTAFSKQRLGWDDKLSKEENEKRLEQFLNNPEKLAELVYGKRMGNTDEGDAYRYRGRGFIQLTGKNNYAAASKDIFGDDRLVKNPDLVNDPNIAALTAVWFIKKNRANMAKQLGIDLSKPLTAEQANLLITSEIAGSKITSGQGYLGTENLTKASKYAATSNIQDIARQGREDITNTLQAPKSQMANAQGSFNIYNVNNDNRTYANSQTNKDLNVTNSDNTLRQSLG